MTELISTNEFGTFCGGFSSEKVSNGQNAPVIARIDSQVLSAKLMCLRFPLSDDLMDDTAGYVCQPEIASCVSIGQGFVFNSQEVEDGGV